VQPVIDVYASTQGATWAGVASDIMKALKPFQDHLPRGTQIVVRGQIETMRSSFFGLGVGLFDGDRAGLFADRGQLSVVARSLYHHYSAAGSAGGDLLVSFDYADHAQCSVR